MCPCTIYYSQVIKAFPVMNALNRLLLVEASPESGSSFSALRCPSQFHQPKYYLFPLCVERKLLLLGLQFQFEIPHHLLNNLFKYHFDLLLVNSVSLISDAALHFWDTHYSMFPPLDFL